MQFAFLFMKSSVNHSSVVYNFRPMFGLRSGFLEGNAFWQIPMKFYDSSIYMLIPVTKMELNQQGLGVPNKYEVLLD